MTRSQESPVPSPSRRADRRRQAGAQVLATALAGLALALLFLAPPPSRCVRVILESRDLAALEAALTGAGGRVTHRLAHLSALAATVPAPRLAELTADPSVRRSWRERRVTAAAWRSPAGVAGGDALGVLPAVIVRADRLHGEGLLGSGVTIAVVDGPPPLAAETLRGADGHRRLLAVYDAIGDRLASDPPAVAAGPEAAHAGSVLGTMLSSAGDGEGGYAGIAPNADLVLVTALAGDGSGRAADVVRGIDWVIANRERYGIRVLNLSLAAPPGGAYWDDPLGLAVMAAWRAGIVVVVAAGNGGPAPATVASPGDVPYVVTVGVAASGPVGAAVPTYSASGPTAAGHLKPELVAPGGAAVPSVVPAAAPTAGDGALRRPAGGTSLAAAVVSGVVALVLEVDPWLSPDQVKHRLLASARPATARDGSAAFPVLRQGAGLVDAAAAAGSGSVATANRGLDIERDLAGVGPAAGIIMGVELDLRPDKLSAAYLWSYGYAEPASGPDGAAGAGGPRPDAGYTWSDPPLTAGDSGSDGSALWGYTWSDPPRPDTGYTWSDPPLAGGDSGSDTSGFWGYTWSD